jgi:hypothetical protein
MDEAGVGIDPADPRGGELAGEEKRPVAVAAGDLEHPLGAADLEDGGGQRRQWRRRAHDP